jgi:hypothetical protein
MHRIIAIDCINIFYTINIVPLYLFIRINYQMNFPMYNMKYTCNYFYINFLYISTLETIKIVNIIPIYVI